MPEKVEEQLQISWTSWSKWRCKILQRKLCVIFTVSHNWLFAKIENWSIFYLMRDWVQCQCLQHGRQCRCHHSGNEDCYDSQIHESPALGPVPVPERNVQSNVRPYTLNVIAAGMCIQIWSLHWIWGRSNNWFVTHCFPVYEKGHHPYIDFGHSLLLAWACWHIRFLHLGNFLKLTTDRFPMAKTVRRMMKCMVHVASRSLKWIERVTLFKWAWVK